MNFNYISEATPENLARVERICAAFSDVEIAILGAAVSTLALVRLDDQRLGETISSELCEGLLSLLALSLVSVTERRPNDKPIQ